MSHITQAWPLEPEGIDTIPRGIEKNKWYKLSEVAGASHVSFNIRHRVKETGTSETFEYWGVGQHEYKDTFDNPRFYTGTLWWCVYERSWLTKLTRLVVIWDDTFVPRDGDKPASLPHSLLFPIDPAWKLPHSLGHVRDFDTRGITYPLQIDIQVSSQPPSDQYLLTTQTYGSGAISKNPNKNLYASGEEVSLLAVPASGWLFHRWVINPGTIITNQNPYILTMDEDKAVRAEFIVEDPQGPYEHRLKINVVGLLNPEEEEEPGFAPAWTQVACGRVDKDPDKVFYDDMENVELTAVPNENWEFREWEGDLTGGTNPENLTMDDDKEVTAVFQRIASPGEGEYMLNVSITGNGHVYANPYKPFYQENQIVELVAVADTGWQFSHWEGDLLGEQNPKWILMDEDKAVTAVFEAAETPEGKFVLAVEINGNGLVAREPIGPFYDPDTVVTLTAIPNPGWVFSEWGGDIDPYEDLEAQSVQVTMDSDKLVTVNYLYEALSWKDVVPLEGYWKLFLFASQPQGTEETVPPETPEDEPEPWPIKEGILVIESMLVTRPCRMFADSQPAEPPKPPEMVIESMLVTRPCRMFAEV